MQIHSCSRLIFAMILCKWPIMHYSTNRNPTTRTIELPDKRWSIVEFSTNYFSITSQEPPLSEPTLRISPACFSFLNIFLMPDSDICNKSIN